MPYNFQATFITPLLLKLDNGEISGPEDWASAITKGYINTIKAGLPQGVPPTLPAPSQLGVPFAIGAGPFTTAASREKLFYNTVYAYYLAKQLSLDKAAVDNLVKMIKTLITKIKSTQQDIRRTIDELKTLSEELKQLPVLIQDIVKEIQAEVKQIIQDLKTSIDSLFNPSKLQLEEAEFNNVFRKELTIYKTLQSFDITNVDSVQTILQFVREETQSIEQRLQVRTPQNLLKNYITDRLIAAIGEILSLADGILNPAKIIDYVRTLAKSKARLSKLWEKLKRFDVFVRYIQPKIRRLEQKKQDLIKELKALVQVKLNDLKNKLSKKTLEYTNKKRESKKVAIFLKAKKKVDDFKKQNEKKIKKVKSNIQLSYEAFKAATAIFEKSINLKKQLEGEFQQIKTDIDSYKKSITEIGKSIQQIPATAGNINVSTGATPTLQQIDQAIIKDKEIALLRSYFNSINLSAFAEVAGGVLLQTASSFSLFKRFFEKRSTRWPKYITEINELEKQIRKLQNTLRKLQDENYKPKPERTLIQVKIKQKSLKDVLHVLITRLRPKAKRIVEKIREFITEQKKELTTKLLKFREDAEIFALSLVPVNSTTEDVKNKKEVALSKKRHIEDTKKKIDHAIKLSKALYKVARGFTLFTENISKGEYKFSANQTNINLMIDNLYIVRMDKQIPTIQKALMLEKAKVKNAFKALYVIESLVYGLIETFKDIANSDFKKEFDKLTQSLTPESVKAVKDLLENPPKTPESIKQAMNGTVLAALNDIRVVNVLLALERKYLQKSRQIVKQTVSLAEELKVTKFYPTLLKIKNCLEKNQSFIVLALNLLKKELKKFTAFVTKKIKEAFEEVRKRLQEFRERVQKQQEERVKVIAKREAVVKADALAASIIFGLAARLFWTGATWVGPTGSNHVVFNIGQFLKIDATIEDGASGFVKQMARGFEAQLTQMSGLIIPPPPTGITPIPFSGYK